MPSRDGAGTRSDSPNLQRQPLARIARNVGSSTASRPSGALYPWPHYGSLLHSRPFYDSLIVVALKMPS